MLGKRDNPSLELLKKLDLTPFKERFPWLGGDLQTLRDTLRSEKLPVQKSEQVKISVPALPNGEQGPGNLLAFLDLPQDSMYTYGLVLILHGLGGSSRRQGLRRMSICLQKAGFAVLRLNLRGADPC